MKIKCSNCKKVTDHYVSKNGEVKCLVCGTTNKVKKSLEVVFEADEKFDDMLNGN